MNNKYNDWLMMRTCKQTLNFVGTMYGAGSVIGLCVERNKHV
jgi:hypothetical protein